MGMSPRLLRPRATGFDPRTISGLALWLDASASSTLYQSSNGTTAASASGDPVGYLGDRSGNGKNATQATANNRPTIAPVTRNGKTVIRFDGLDDFLTFADSSIQTIMCVVTCQSQASRQLNSLIGYRNPANTQDNASVGIRRDSSPANTTTWRGVGNVNVGDFTNPASSQFRVNGVSTNTVNDGVWHVLTAIRGGSAVTNINNIAAWYSAREFGGDIAEIICFDNAISNAARDKVEKYLAQKWGLTLG